MWITLPSTANMVNVQEICEKSEHVTSKWKLVPPFQILVNIDDNVFDFCSIVLLK